jgi:S1-C subfamily serine protease
MRPPSPRSGGSGFNVHPQGIVITAAHCVAGVGQVLWVQFPNGDKYRARCYAHDPNCDLAALKLVGAANLPVIRIAHKRAEPGDWVAIIGSPGSRRYGPFHVSTGHIKQYHGDPKRGSVSHTAWTYWGSSGSPVLNDGGALVAVHTSYISQLRQRHGVRYETLRDFLMSRALGSPASRVGSVTQPERHSSVPPSQNPLQAAKPVTKKPTGRSPGGQPRRARTAARGVVAEECLRLSQ